MLPQSHWKQWLGIALLIAGAVVCLSAATGHGPTVNNTPASDAFGAGVVITLGLVILYLGTQDRTREMRETQQYLRDLDAIPPEERLARRAKERRSGRG